MSGSWSLSIPPENRGSRKGLVVEKDDLLLLSKAASYLNENSMLKPLLPKHKNNDNSNALLEHGLSWNYFHDVFYKEIC